MITRDMLIGGLREMGYTASSQDIVRDGVRHEGIDISDDMNVAPLFFAETIIKIAEEKDYDVKYAVEILANFFERVKTRKFSTTKLNDRRFLIENTYISLQRISEENIIKRPSEFEGLEEYLYAYDYYPNGMWGIKLPNALLEHVDMTEAELWNIAERNTSGDSHIAPLSSICVQRTGILKRMNKELTTQLFILTTRRKFKGCGAVTNKKMLCEFGRRFSTDKIVVIPSSVNEVLLCPYNSNTDIKALSEIVKTVNAINVSPDERLTDMVYIVPVVEK